MERVATAIGGRIDVTDDQSRSALILVSPEKNVHEIVQLILKVEQVPGVNYATPAIEFPGE